MTSSGITTSCSFCPLYDVDRMKSTRVNLFETKMGDSNTFRFGDRAPRVRFKEPMKKREKLLRYPGVDDMLSSRGVGKEPLIPYEDNEIRTDPDQYMTRGERKTDVDETALDNFIGRICLAAALDVSDDKEYAGIMDPYDGHVTNPESLMQVLEDGRLKVKKGDKKGKRVKREKRKLVQEYMTESYERPSVPSVTIALKEFRYLICSEVESKARVIHDFYQYQWDHMQEDRIDAYRSLFMWKDQHDQLHTLVSKLKMDLENVTASRDSLVSEIESMKKAKRRRSGAQRRRTRELAARSQSNAQAQQSEALISGNVEQSQSVDEDCSR